MYTYYNSKPDGTIDTQITSGIVGNLFSSVSIAERVSGDDELQKMWIMNDSDSNTYIGIKSYSAYWQNVFVSASDTDTESDLTGSETRYGALKVVSALATAITVTKDAFFTLARVGDTIAVENAPYEIASITDNGDDTLDITATIDYISLPPVGGFITSMFTLDLTTGVAKPFWRERKVIPGSTWSGGSIVVDILIGN